MAATSEPVIVLFKSKTCSHCRTLSNNWGAVSAALTKEYPRLRFFTVECENNQGRFDPNSYPKDMIRFAGWFPAILLIPGWLWDDAMANLGPKNPVQLKDGVQMFNGTWKNGRPEYVNRYDMRVPAKFGEWLREAMANKDFRAVQDHPKPIGRPSHSTSSFLTPISNPGNASSSYTSSPGKPNDICAMRIISRRK